MIYPWHKIVWGQLRHGLGREHHAVLLHGPAGTGKRRFAQLFAQSLLCTIADRRPCGECQECRWFAQGTHPDFRLLTPEALRPEADGDPEDQAPESARGERKAATQIIIEQIRELQDFLSLTPHRAGGRRVVLVQPAEAMNIFAANALLKMLEEPPAQTVFLLVTDALRRLPPTIISRCRRLAMPAADGVEALAWLREQGVADAEVLLAQAGGAPLAAMALAEAGEQDERRRFLDQLTRLTGPGSALELAAAAQKIALPTVVRWLSTWCYDLMAARLTASTRYHPDYVESITTIAARLALDQLLLYQDLLKVAARSVAHPLNPRLFLEQLLLSYARVTTTPTTRGHV